MKLISQIVAILAALGNYLGRLRRHKEQQEHEEEAREIEEDPVRWMDDHFNGPGSDDDRVQQPSSMPDDASGTGKADPSEPDPKR